jgi:polysaccharide deactylase WbmS-like protein
LRSKPDLFELGIHPNFMPGSTHGDSPETVLETCMRFVPDALSVRTHGLFQWGNLFDYVMSLTPITFDVSLFLPMAQHVEVVKYERFGQVLWRVPYVWEDDYIMEASHVGDRSDSVFSGFDKILDRGHGVQVFNFHPIHIVLNSNSMEGYGAMKREHPKLAALTQMEVAPFVERRRAGTQTALVDLVSAVVKRGRGNFVRELQD